MTRPVRLRELPAAETPRVRLQDVGPAALSDVELLAILLGSGIAGVNALDLARRLLVDHGGWAGLLRADIATLYRSAGIGVAKAASIKAALEIGRRRLLAESEQRLQVKSPADIAPLLIAEMGHLDQEHLRTVLLDTKNRVQAISTVYIGSLNASLIRIGEIFKEISKQNSLHLRLSLT
jgi:DNA repair protein RadC